MHIFSLETKKVQCTITTRGIGIRSFSLCQKIKYIGLVDHDGTVYVHFLNTRSTSLQEVRVDSHDCVCTKFRMVDTSIARDYNSYGFKLSWSPATDGLLAIPTSNGIVLLYKNNDLHSSWEEKFLLGSGEITHGNHAVTIVQFSPDGNHIASADVQGVVIIWKLESLEHECPAVALRMIALTSENAQPEIVEDLVWGPSSTADDIIVVTKSSWTKLSNVLDVIDHQPDTAQTGISTSDQIRKEDSTKQVDDEILLSQDALAFQSTQVVVNPLSEKPAPRKRLQKNREGDAEEANDIALDNDEIVDTSIANIKKGNVVMDDEDNDMIEDEDYPDADFIEGSDEANKVESLLQAIKGNVTLAAQKIELQKSFQPSSTKEDEKQRRYLVWNSVGQITSRNEGAESRVEIKFANQSGSNRNEVLVDRSGFIMAALSYEGAVFATAMEVDPDKNNPYASEFKKTATYYGSTIYYKAFPSQPQMRGCNESFQMTLAEEEEALAVAVGKGWVAVATSKQLLRIFSSTGLQLSTIWLRGPVVSMCGLDSRLAVVYHGGVPINENFSLKVDIYEMQWENSCGGSILVDALHVPLTAKSTLTWLGFETGSMFLVAMDSAGVVSMLIKSMGWQWMPVLEVEKVRKSVDHKYWPVFLRESTLVYVLLNGENKPAVYPTPVVSTRKLRISLVEKKDGHKLSEVLVDKGHQLMWSLAKTSHWECIKSDLDMLGPSAAGVMDANELEDRLQAQQKEADKVFLILMQDACVEQRDAVALNLAFKLRSLKAMEAGIKVANNLGRTALAAALDTIIEQKLQEQQMQLELQQNIFPAAEDSRTAAAMSDYAIDSQLYSQMGQESNYIAGKLSSKVSNNAALTIMSVPSATKTVSPVADESIRDATQPSKPSVGKAGYNPFAVSSTASPMKRKNTFSAVQDLKTSPSPKKPAMSVSALVHILYTKEKYDVTSSCVFQKQSSFAKGARMQVLADKKFL